MQGIMSIIISALNNHVLLTFSNYVITYNNYIAMLYECIAVLYHTGLGFKFSPVPVNVSNVLFPMTSINLQT